jgi:DNA-directed RNA polymerase subunit M
MIFCPKCGTRLVPRQKDGNENVIACPKCGYEEPTTAEITITQKKSPESKPREDIVVIGKEEKKIRTLPTIKIECPKCSNTEAYWWLVQTRGSDEATTQFFKCTKCSYTWREYS